METAGLQPKVRVMTMEAPTGHAVNEILETSLTQLKKQAAAQQFKLHLEASHSYLDQGYQSQPQQYTQPSPHVSTLSHVSAHQDLFSENDGASAANFTNKNKTHSRKQ